MKTISPPARFVELDLWRGSAVLAMVLFHFVFDLAFFAHAPVDMYSGFWFWFARAIAGSFIFIAGVSIPLALHRKKPASEKTYLVRRGLFLFGLGMIITLITYFLFSDYTIWFGVLHALGVCTLLSIFFASRPRLSFAFGGIIFLLGVLFSIGRIPFPNWIGIFPVSFPTFDYFPLFPWLGVFLLGISVSARVYSRSNPRAGVSIPSNLFTRFLTGCGQRSLWIYLVHQPVLIGLIFLFTGKIGT